MANGFNLNIPAEGEVRWNDVAAALQIADTMRRRQEGARDAAVRYAGQQELQQAIGAGKPFIEALTVAAPKLYYNDPEGLARIGNIIASRTQKDVGLVTEPMTVQGMPVEGKAIVKNPRTGAFQIVDTGQGITAQLKGEQSILRAELASKRRALEALEARDDLSPEQQARAQQLRGEIPALTEQLRKSFRVTPANVGTAIPTPEELQGQQPSPLTAPLPALQQGGMVVPPTGATQEQAPAAGSPATSLLRRLGWLPTAAAPAPTARVKVVSPSGKVGTVPASQLETALKQGYKRAQ